MGKGNLPDLESLLHPYETPAVKEPDKPNPPEITGIIDMLEIE